MRKSFFGISTPSLSRSNSGTSTPVNLDLVETGTVTPVVKVVTESDYAVASRRPKCAPSNERDGILTRLLDEARSPPTSKPLYGCQYLPRATLASHLINLHLIPQIINDYPASRAGDMMVKLGNPNTAYAKWPTLSQNLSSEGIKDRLLLSISEDMHQQVSEVLQGIDEICGTFWGKTGLVKAGYAALRSGPGEVIAAPDEIVGEKALEMRRYCEMELKRLRVLEREMRFGIWKDYKGTEVDPMEWMESQKQLRYMDIARVSNRNHTVELVKKCMNEKDIEEEEEEGEGGIEGGFAGVVEKVMEAGEFHPRPSLAAH